MRDCRITVGSNLLTVIMVYVTSVPASYRGMATGPNIVLTNIMACHIFRSTKFGLISDSTYFSSRSHPSGSIPVELRRSDRGAMGDAAIRENSSRGTTTASTVDISKRIDCTDEGSIPMETPKGGYWGV